MQFEIYLIWSIDIANGLPSSIITLAVETCNKNSYQKFLSNLTMTLKQLFSYNKGIEHMFSVSCGQFPFYGMWIDLKKSFHKEVSQKYAVFAKIIPLEIKAIILKTVMFHCQYDQLDSVSYPALIGYSFPLMGDFRQKVP